MEISRSKLLDLETLTPWRKWARMESTNSPTSVIWFNTLLTEDMREGRAFEEHHMTGDLDQVYNIVQSQPKLF